MFRKWHASGEQRFNGLALWMSADRARRRHELAPYKSLWLCSPTSHRIVGEAQKLAIEAIRPGVPGRSVHMVAHDHLAKHAFGDNFPHALGHSLGLNIHERPALSDWEIETIEVGNVITVEPGIYLPGRYGVRTEDLILVTKSGCVLDRTDHALMVR